MADEHTNTAGEQSDFRTGVVAMVGRPNAGKSTLVNSIVGEELSVVTSLPQTTRHNFRGIYTSDNVQLVFVDTPGMHARGHAHNRAMTNESRELLRERGVDLVCYVVDMGRDFGPEEDTVAESVVSSGLPLLIIFNKIDRCPDMTTRLSDFRQRYPALNGRPSIHISALSPEARDTFLETAVPMVPEGPPLYPPDEISDENLRFFASEYLRKGIILNTQAEVPHAACVEILQYRESEARHDIEAVIHVETVGQRAILVGKRGSVIGRIRRVAEREMERLTGVPALFHCHVKVTAKWRDKPGFLRSMGYRNP